MADSKKYIGIYDTLEDVQDALDNGQLSNPYVAKTMDNGKIDYNSLSPVDYSQYWCTYYPIDAKIWVQTGNSIYDRTEYTGGDGKISKADLPNFYGAGSKNYNGKSTVTKFKYFQFDSTSATTSFYQAWYGCSSLTEFPMIDTSNCTNFMAAWYGCYSLKSFPALYFSKGETFDFAWYGCRALTEFPALDLHNGSSIRDAWIGCSSLTTLGGFGAIKESIYLSDSPNLTVDSIMNVITQAADLNSLGITGKTMTFGSTNLAKLTDAQKSVATSKGWTLA